MPLGFLGPRDADRVALIHAYDEHGILHGAVYGAKTIAISSLYRLTTDGIAVL